jgi:signal peptidase II
VGPLRRRSSLPALFLGVAVVIVDQLSKWIAGRSLVRGESVEVIGDFFRLTHVQNPGGAFGLFRGSGGAFTLLSVIAVAVLLYALWRVPPRAGPARLALGTVLGGAVGNLVDRLRFESVVDFFDVGVGELRWPVFNVADAAVVVGVGLFLIFSFRAGDAGAGESDVPGEEAGSHHSAGTGTGSA